MFNEFRQFAKLELKSRKVTYSQLSQKTGFAENTIKCFMCGRDKSRNVAEAIADFLGVNLVYSNGSYHAEKIMKATDIPSASERR